MKSLKLILCSLAFVMVSGSLFAADDQLADGKEQFEYWCATCHSPNLYRGNYLPGTASLLEKYNGQVPAALEQRTDLVAEYVKVVIRHGSEGMPSFRKTEISDSQMEDIAAYLSR